MMHLPSLQTHGFIIELDRLPIDHMSKRKTSAKRASISVLRESYRGERLRKKKKKEREGSFHNHLQFSWRA